MLGRLGDELLGVAVAEHEGDARAGVLGVKRQVGCAGLEHGEHGDDELGAALEQDGDDLFRPNALGAQVVRELIGARIELGVGELLGVLFLILKHECAGLGGERGLALKELGQAAGRVRQCDGGSLALFDQCQARRLVIERECGDRGLGVIGCGLDEVLESLE